MICILSSHPGQGASSRIPGFFEKPKAGVYFKMARLQSLFSSNPVMTFLSWLTEAFIRIKMQSAFADIKRVQ